MVRFNSCTSPSEDASLVLPGMGVDWRRWRFFLQAGDYWMPAAEKAVCWIMPVPDVIWL